MDNCEIRWDDHTQYDTARHAAQQAWENLAGSDNCVDLEPDTWNTFADLDWRDVNRPDVDWAGLYEPRNGTDRIYLNEAALDYYTTCQQKGLAMHELGHAHGIGHSGIWGNIMGDNNGICTLGSHDVDDYESLWRQQ